MTWLRNTAYVLIAVVALSGCASIKGLLKRTMKCADCRDAIDIRV